MNTKNLKSRNVIILPYNVTFKDEMLAEMWLAEQELATMDAEIKAMSDEVDAAIDALVIG